MKLVALLLALSLTASAQTTFTDPANLRGERVSPSNGHELPIDRDALGLAQLLRRLNTRASILNIVAHPDDEDGGMLTLYSRGLGARVTDLSLTRGEGGQNFVTGDFEDALGLIRTQELLSNDRYTGVSQLFGTEVDFGFSKTKEEAFAKWTHDRVLYDAVRAIRLVRPLVITATFIGNVTDGHGQHQVSGEIAQEAFVAAADPSVFPDQIAEGLLPWQALKIYARVPFADVNSKGVFDYATGQYVPARFTNYVTGKVTTTKPSADVNVPEGETDPLLTTAAANSSDIPSTFATNPNTPLSYAQFSRIGLGLQRTQISKNMRLPVAGSYDSGYTLYGSVLCNAPANARVPSITPKTCHPDQPQRAEGEQVPRGFSLVAFNPSNEQVPRGFSLGSHGPSPESGFSPQGMPSPSAHEPAPTARPITAQGNALGKQAAASQAPTARSIPAHGNAVGNREEESPRAEGPIQNSNLTTQPNFFTGIDTSIEGIATLAPSAKGSIAIIIKTNLAGIAHSIAEASLDFKPDHPELAANRLSEALALTNITIDNITHFTREQLPTEEQANLLHELRIKRVQLNDALILSLGLHLDATSPAIESIVGTPATVHTILTTKSPERIPYFAEHLQTVNGTEQIGPNSDGSPAVTRDRPWMMDLTAQPTLTRTLTQPYFYRDNIEQPIYKLRDTDLRNASQTPAAITAWAELTYQSADITLGRVVHNGPQPISIIPPVSIDSLPTATVLPNGQTTAQLTATLRTDATTSANINVQSPHNWSIEAKAVPAPANDPTHSIHFYLHPTAPITGPQIFHVTAQTPDHHTYTEGFRPVGYPGLIYTNYYTPATTRVVPVDLKLPAHVRIAYLPGTGDPVPEALASIGLAPTMITVADLTPANLANFDTVILGVRAYTANPNLHGAPTQTLLDFARNGGNVLVQYETSGLTSADAPYPLNLGSAEKVVDETAPVQLLAPTNPLLTNPNAITSADFNNWIAERGHGFLSTWDPHYTALTDTHDPGGPETAAQLPQRGGLITTTVGKGRWTYCAFALYRQLPEAVPGAFRLFVNLITPTR
jgi:LmbE family N-acetylglucosaminyl deacetylase